MYKRKTENGKRKVFIFLLLFCIGMTATAQQKKLTKEEIATYEKDIKNMVSYLQETFNFIGDPNQSSQEKEIIFSQSYTKVFQDDKVQIEDDLDNRRGTNISKDVQAYLKDIDFFFQTVQFTFNIQNINNLYKEDGSPYFKVTMSRKLVGKTVTNDSINDQKTRYMEVNLDQKNRSLKIASIYTTKINERQTLRYWWNSMPSPWKNYFAKDLKINDTIPLKSVMQVNEGDFIYGYPILSNNGDETLVTAWKETNIKAGLDNLYNILKTLCATKEIDVANIKTITNLEPLLELSDLVSLNLEGTNVNDLSPLRNANKLQTLNISNTQISDLSPLKYDVMITDLDLSETEVSDLSTLVSLSRLEKLDISNTEVSDLKPLESCPDFKFLIAEGSKVTNLNPLAKNHNLIALNVSNTQVKDLFPINSLPALQSLKISNTQISSLEALSEMKTLTELYCSNTDISDLSPLKNHRRLNKVYCDNSGVTVTKASEFSKENPFTLVIYDTNALSEWWNKLPIYWKAVFAKQANIQGNPTTEQLHEVINMTDLDLSGNEYMQNLIPVSRLTNLVNLNISNTDISQLEPLYGMTNLETIQLEGTYVSNLSPLANMSRLRVLNINSTPVSNIVCLANDSHLETIWAEGTAVNLTQVKALKEKLPGVTVVFQSEQLQNWWNSLDDNWKSILKQHVPCANLEPTRLELHKMTGIRNISIDQENSVASLEPIRNFFWLEKANFNHQGIRDIQPLANKYHLTELQLKDNPISDLTPLENDTLLSVLNVENTQITDIAKLERLTHLRILNAGGTAIKNLKPLAKMRELEELLINNTNVKSISPIENIPSLKLLKLYNTKVKSKTVNDLQQKRYDLNIVYY